MTAIPVPRNPVARQLLARLLAIGLVLALLTAAAQLFLDYQRDLAELYERLDDVETSYLPSLRENAWLDDRERLTMLAEGIAGLEGIAQVQIAAPDGRVVAEAGNAPRQPLTRSWDLIRDYSGQPVLLGRLVVTAGLETLQRAALARMGVTLAATLALLAVLAASLYWQVHVLVTSRLHAIAGYARRLGRDGPAATAAPPMDADGGLAEDEFSDLGATLSHMHAAIAAAHEALAAGEARYRELFTSSPVPLWEEDFSAVQAAVAALPAGIDLPAWLDANPDFIRTAAGLVRVLDVNDAGITMHRATGRRELLTRLPAIFTPASLDAFRAQIEAIHARKWDLCRETQVRTLDGDVLEIMLHWHVPPSHRHNFARVIVAAEDISALKAARRSSELTLERLMEANAELERFTVVAAHDLQEPVRAVVSFAQLLERRLLEGGELKPEAREFLDYLCAAAQRMQAQVAGLQDYAQASHGTTFAPVGLADAVADASALLNTPLAEVGARLDLGELPTVYGDRAQLAQLFRHLLDNAVKFRRGGTALVIAITAQRDGGLWRITVRDNGIGIDPAYAPTVFELFRRLHGPGHFPGAGIGLTICRRIVERHGGSIAIDGSAIDGTAIAFTLPAVAPPPPTLASPPAGA